MILQYVSSSEKHDREKITGILGGTSFKHECFSRSVSEMFIFLFTYWLFCHSGGMREEQVRGTGAGMKEEG